MGQIYIIENIINNKLYVGKTQYTIKERWKSHISDMKRNKGNSKLYNAITKYGIDNFRIFVCEYTSFIKLNDREKYWIEVLEPEYNITKGGTGGRTWQGIVKKTWQLSDIAKENIRKGVLKRFSEGFRYTHYDNMRGDNNPMVKGFYITPWGEFTSDIKAAIQGRKEKKKGFTVITDPATIKKYCKNPNLIFGNKSPKDWKGKTAKEIGFSYREKNNTH